MNVATRDPLALPSQPPALPWIGHALDFGRDPLAFLTRVTREHGDFVTMRFTGKRFHLLSHPDDIEQVLVRDARHYEKDEFTEKLSDVLGQGLLTSGGEHWRRQRKLASVAFQPRRVESYGSAMVELAEAAASRVRDGAVLDLHGAMMALTLDVVADTLFGTVVREHAHTFAEALEVFQERYEGVFGTGIVLPLSLPLPIHGRLRRQRAEIDRYLYGLIAERRRQRASRADLLQTLLDATDDDGSRMSDEQVRDEAVTLFMAGHETTALTLTYAFRLLTQNPAAYDALERELASVLGERPPTVEDLPRLVYTEAVVKECLRLLPPVWMVGRRAIEPVALRGIMVEPGDTVGMSQWVVHRDARFFPQPLAFRPERWLSDETRRLTRFAFFPFGGGPRVCIGNHFASLEAVLLLAAILRNHRVEVDLGAPFRLEPSVTIRPSGPVPARFVRRRARSVG